MAIWRIDPDTLNLVEEVEERPRPGGYTWDEFNEVERPACPACGMSVNVQAARSGTPGNPLYIPGRWSCPDVGCDSRRAH